MNAYARSTMDPTQDAPPPSETIAAPVSDLSFADQLAANAEAARAERQRTANAVGGAMRQGLVRWTTVVVTGAVVAFVLRVPDAALFLVAAALFALAQSWDVRDRARTGDPVTDLALEPGGVGTVLRVLVPLVVPFSGVVLYGALAYYAHGFQSPTLARIAAMQWCSAAAVVCVFIGFPPIAQQLARAFMRGGTPGHTDRLTASMALVILLLPVPMALLGEEVMGLLQGNGHPLASIGELAGQLVGEVVFALSAVGLWVGRDWKAVRERLGLGGLGGRNVVFALLALLAVYGANTGMEWLERTFYPALWMRDQDATKLIAGNMSMAAAVLLGISAGVGEEITVRGALQPRMGLFWSSLLFAALHVQYTWFGMLTILVIGVTLGVVRNRANTTTAIVVHGLWDIIAALGAR